MNARIIRNRIRQQHHSIFQQLQKNRYLEFLQNLLEDETSLQDLFVQISTGTQYQFNRNHHSQYDQNSTSGPGSVLTQVFGTQLYQLKKQLKIQKQKLNRVNEEQVYSEFADNAINKILELNQKINKLKQFYLYCKYLKKSTQQLQNDIEKYFEFQKQQSTVAQQLLAYLSDSYISDVIFKQYLKTYNVNIFTSDLIGHYFELNQKGLLRGKQKRNLIFEPERIPQLCILQKKNIVFKQLYDINQKYTQMGNQIKDGYIDNLIDLMKKLDQSQKFNQNNRESINTATTQNKSKKQETFEQYHTIINQKLQNLNYLINKMSLIGNNLNQNLQSTHVPLLVNQYHQNFALIKKNISLKSRSDSKKDKNQHYKKFLVSLFLKHQTFNQKQSLAAFFQENLIVDSQSNLSSQNQTEKNLHKFQFLTNKIIKNETIYVLNKLFSALNVFSYIYEQVNPSSCKETEFGFRSLTEFIQKDFKGQFTKIQSQPVSQNHVKRPIVNFHHSPSHKSHYNVFIETDQLGNWMLLTGNLKLIYPSAVFGLVETLHYMSEVATILQAKALYSDELMLQILSLKVQQVSKLGEVIINIFNIIKSKQVASYDLLSQYLILCIKGIFDWQLQWIQKLQLSNHQNQMFKNDLQEIQITKQTSLREDLQVDFEKQYRQERQRVSDQIRATRISKIVTFYAEKAKKADFLSQIIYEIDTSYDIAPILQRLLQSQLFHNRTFYFYDNIEFYQTVLYEIIQMRNHIKLDHYFTLPKLHEKFAFFTKKVSSFHDILAQLSQISQNQIQVQELLTFFKTQLRLKRNVFRGQLHWLSYKGFVQNGKQKSFKDFVQEQGLDIFSLSEQSLAYFLSNIRDFIRRVNLFEQQIEKFKYYEDILGKLNLSTIKIKNFDSYLNILTNPQLKQLTKVLNYFNPITKILKNQQHMERLFADLKTMIRNHNKIKLGDLSKHILMLEERQKLGEDVFYHKSFGFQLQYHDCYNLFIEQQRKSYLLVNETLKLSINREKYNMEKMYDDCIAEDKRKIHLTLLFYRHLTLLSLLLAKQELIDEGDKEIIQDLLQSLSFPANIIIQIKYLHQIFQLQPQSDKQSAEVYVLLKIKKFLHRLIRLTQSKENVQSAIIYNNNRSIENICMIAKLSTYTQKKIQQKIQQIMQEITVKDVIKNKKMEKQLQILNNKFLAYFLKLIKRQINQFENTNKLTISSSPVNQTNQKAHNFTLNFSNIDETIYQIEALLLHKVLGLKKLQSEFFQNKQELDLFGQLSGYKIRQQFQQGSQLKARGKDLMRRNDRKALKKGVFSPARQPNGSQSNIMQNIQKRVGIEIIKQSMILRKIISKLELEQKKMRDEISWQTSNLQHNVIRKIHAFIAESNIDQEQSYINFKYTVNLQTIKGMQNVIKEQTQLAYKATMIEGNLQKNNSSKQKEIKQHLFNVVDKKPKKTNNDFFLTNPKQAEQTEPQSLLEEQNSHMLNTNIESIFNHMKKIKVFAAWKRINRNMDLTNQQWNKFNKNVARILHNEENIQRVEVINSKREDCFKQNILCSLLKEENKILSQKIRKSKMESLNKTIQKYRKRLVGGQDNDSGNEEKF